MTGKDYLALSFRLIGILFLALAAGAAARSIFFVRSAVEVTGVIVEHTVVQHSVGLGNSQSMTGHLYYPVVEYESPQGETHRFTGRTGRRSPESAVGERVPVLVAVTGSQQPRVRTLMGVWGSAVVLAGLSAVFFLVSALAPMGFGGAADRRSSRQ